MLLTFSSYSFAKNPPLSQSSARSSYATATVSCCSIPSNLTTYTDLNPPAGDTTSGLYCQQWNKCVAQCPENLDIPTMRRIYMYAYGYRNLSLARHTMDRADQHGLSCKDCKECLVTCTMGFDVKGKILDIARIREIPEDMIYLT